ncbi:VRR-NUC domain-containing protein [Photobacterium alginatilyticum]|uniref:phosphodiesterase I n=1 Tax=Photobacterium alginatilyticum TaxID=1775171 RepID=A0ABW9YS61_9GAMM|nr:VRR-NUC domain-containing protein [Photobacterium alginatilyticum]NBI55609.1 VRR-NUC domain-containing protein [Photobacterium alginatilyticum]
MTPIVLAPDYYLHNFRLLIDSVNRQYSDLLCDEEAAWIVTFQHLPEKAQMLCIRLLSRKGLFFRCDKLSYEEIGDISLAAEALHNVGFVESNKPDWPLEEVISLFTKPELLKLFPALAPCKSYRKPELIEELLIHAPALDEFKQDIIQICHQQHLDTFLLLFFGNRYQDLSQFVLSDLGLNQFESYTIDKESRLFSDRRQIQQWLELSSLSDHYWQAKENKDQAEIVALTEVIPSACQWPPLERRRQQLINHIARDLERFDMPEQALKLFRENLLPPSRERQVRILDKLQQFEAALELTLAIKQSPHNEDEAEVAERLEKKLSRTLKRTYQPVAKAVFNENHLTLANNGQRVELAVAAHYASLGWSVYYLENSLLCGLFGLAFWDIIFAPVPGAFLNPYQRSPRDMFHPEFYQQREVLINQRLTDISNNNWQAWTEIYRNKQGISNDWVNWSVLTEDIVLQATSAIPSTILCELFKRLLFDPRNNRSGLPDLIMFKAEQYQWVEVKGPGDKLQNNQIRWLKKFAELGCPASVDYVTWK